MGGGPAASPLFFVPMQALRIAALAFLAPSLMAGCVHAGTPADRLSDFDARVRADLGIPDAAPSPRLVVLDGRNPDKLDKDLKALLDTSGGGLYDRRTQTIYIDGTRYREGSIYHELVHHYFPFIPEKQREECLARLYEVLATLHSSFNGCAP